MKRQRIIFTALSIGLFLAFAQFAGTIAEAQQTADPRVADLVKAGKLDFAKVDTGIAGELMIEVKNGVTPGQEIVTGPFKVLRQIKEGDKVIINNEKPKDDKGPSAS